MAEILSYQCSDGGWALMGDESDVDMTAMALTALAPYKDDVEVKAAVDAALAYLSDAQQDDGGFMGWGTVLRRWMACALSPVRAAASATATSRRSRTVWPPSRVSMRWPPTTASGRA